MTTGIALPTRMPSLPGRFDFKDALVGTGDQKAKEKLNESIAKTACALANTGGGYLIFGVKDRKHSSRLTPRQRCLGISNRGDLRKELGDRAAAKEALSGFPARKAWTANQIQFLEEVVNHLTQLGAVLRPRNG